MILYLRLTRQLISKHSWKAITLFSKFGKYFENSLHNVGFYISYITKKSRFKALWKQLENKSGQEIQNAKIRLGGCSDGGYFVPDCLEGITSCISPGVGHTIQFEKDLRQKYCIPSVLVDATVNEPIDLPEDCVFLSMLVAPISETSRKQISIRDLISYSDSKFGSGDLILQMDIEGSEIDILKHISETDLRRFRILVIEFHYLGLWGINEYFDQYIWPIFEKITNSFEIFCVEPNLHSRGPRIHGVQLPAALEITFLRFDL